MRVGRVLGTTVLGAALALLAANAAGAAPLPVTRVAGESRYDTSAQVSARFAPHPPVAFVASADTFPDALSAGPAAAHRASPVLLVRQDAIPQSVQTELHRVHPDNIILLGGTGAVSQRVGEKLLDVNYTNGTVTRIAGADRYETSAMVSAATFAPGVSVAYVATGADFADALSGAAAAGAAGGPVLLVRPDSIPSTIAAELTRLKPTSIVLLGGTSSISGAVQTALGAYSKSVTRQAGADRYATSAAVSAAAFPNGAAAAYVVSGEAFPDALSASSPAATTRAPVLLVRASCMPTVISQEIDRLKATSLVVVGGPDAVSDSAANRTSCPTG